MLKRLLAFCCIWCCASSGLAEESDLTQLSAWLSALHSSRGEFTQRVTDQEGELLQESQGDFALLQPAHLQWRTQAPYDYLVLSDGEWVWRYDADLEQAIRDPLGDTYKQTPALLIAGNTEQISASYELSREDQGEQQRFVLIPKEEEAFSELTLTFNAQGDLLSLGFTDTLNQHTVIEFTQIRQDADLTPAAFHFTPPEGTDVILNES